MKTVRKAALWIVCVMVIGILGGCSYTFDASEYLKASLDNYYKGDPTGFVDLNIGTADEAEELYQEGIDAQVGAFTDITMMGVEPLSDELVAGCKDTFEKIFKHVKYTVGDAAKQSDGSYEVAVEYEQLQVFGPAWDATMSDEAAYESAEELYQALKDNLDAALAAPTYGETQTTNITIDLKDNTYMVNSDDMVALGKMLIDYEAVE